GERRRSDEPAQAAALLDEATAEANRALDALRALARGIFPVILADRGVLSALQAHIEQRRLPVRIDGDGLVGGARFDPQAEASVFFCVTEAVADALARSGGPVSVQLATIEGGLEFEVVAEGGGGGRIDVVDLRDRVEAVGGSLEVRTGPGRGSAVCGWVPALPAV